MMLRVGNMDVGIRWERGGKESQIMWTNANVSFVHHLANAHSVSQH